MNNSVEILQRVKTIPKWVYDMAVKVYDNYIKYNDKDGMHNPKEIKLKYNMTAKALTHLEI